MSRVIKGWTPENVGDTPVAPHRYRWDREDFIDDTPGAMKVREWCVAQPYQPGEVVWVWNGEDNKKARVLGVYVDYDYYGDRRPKYRVQFETKTGLWSKLFDYVSPGHIQRGYYHAGLAPEIPEGVM